MDTEDLGNTRFMNILFKLSGMTMESQMRRWLMPPTETLSGADLKPGQTVLEVGCGTGFFTLPAAEIIEESGHLIAMDPLSGFVERVREKIQEAGLKNVKVIQRDALNTKLESSSVDRVLLFGVVPFPTLPLNKLLPEMHRILKPDGVLAVWLFPTTAGVPTAISRTGLFSGMGKKKGVYRYKRLEKSETLVSDL